MQTVEGKTPMQQTTEWATIGKIVAPFGIHGELKVFSLSDIPDRFVTLDAVYVGPLHARFAVKRARPYKGNTVLLTLAGIDDANAADELRNNELFIPAENLSALPADSYYQHDILGLHVYTLEGHELGVIEEILETGSNDVYTIARAGGKQVLIPAIKQVVKRVDLAARRMYIDPIAGLLDDEEASYGDSNNDEGGNGS